MPVVGTAGHIDHGKTALVRALTGQDTDRLKEEKERGISIDLGFAHLELPNGERVGVVDVPGHERFIRNMLAGAHGMDVVLLVVAADDGVMPQTEEHLDILHLLGVARGIVVVTKIDLVDAARVARVTDDVRARLAGTTLAGAPVVAVSSATGAGLDRLRALLVAELARPPAPAPPAPFRLPIDRVFAVRGHGVVATGTALADEVRPGDALRVLPEGPLARVRSLQAHGVDQARGGWGRRLAVGLSGVAREALARGAVLCDPALERGTTRFDAWVEVCAAAGRPLANHARVRVHAGTAEALGRVLIWDAELPPRAGGWARIVLRRPVVVLRGDRFVLRDETARRTIGGGQVADAWADARARRTLERARLLEALRGTDDAAAAAAVLELDPGFATELPALAASLGRTAEAARDAVARVEAAVTIPDADAWTTRAKWERLAAAARAAVEADHRARPLAPGIERETLRARLPWPLAPRVFRWAVDRLVADGTLVRVEGALAAPGRAVALAPAAQALAGRVERLLADAGMTPPDLRALEAALGAGRRQLLDVLGVLEHAGRVVRVRADLYFAPDAAAEARARLERHCRAAGTITPAAFRDLLGASRKYTIALLEWLDRTQVTFRVGDVRKLRRP